MKIWSILACLFLIFTIKTEALFAEKDSTNSVSPSQITIFFDAHGVLVLTDTFAALKMLGLGRLMRYSISKGIAPWKIANAFKDRFFQFLHTIPLTQEEQQIIPSFDPKGIKLPIIMTAYLNGIITSAEILSRIEKHAQSNRAWFSSKTEMKLIIAQARMIFTPKRFASIQKPNPRAIEFLEKCKDSGIKVRILSNFDAESFAILQAKYPELFHYFASEDIILSGNLKLGKPNHELYQTVFSGYNPAATWFIDDQEINLVFPQKMGINTVHFSNNRSYLGLYKKAAEFPDIQTFLPQPNILFA